MSKNGKKIEENIRPSCTVGRLGSAHLECVHPA